MRFGPVPVSAATGAILAHSVALPGGRLRKGLVLDRTHVAALAAAGLTHVTVARLTQGDVHEDAAAERLARVLAGDDDALTRSVPFTGRVNLLAAQPGVAVLDAARITAVNAVDSMITVATVPPFHQLQPGGLLATVKIISYAVPEAALSDAMTKAAGAIRLATPVLRSASLIITDSPGGPGAKGAKAVLTRLERLEIELAEPPLRCAHDEAALAVALGQAGGALVLVLTGSATSDIADTAPAALRRAGGRIERFGMPVDPGNLLFLGELAGRPVIGLPGSARSPVLHGVDWVMTRLACGIPVTSADIAAMGVGGLLKEIPTRPMPRQGRMEP